MARIDEDERVDLRQSPTRSARWLLEFALLFFNCLQTPASRKPVTPPDPEQAELPKTPAGLWLAPAIPKEARIMLHRNSFVCIATNCHRILRAAGSIGPATVAAQRTAAPIGLGSEGTVGCLGLIPPSLEVLHRPFAGRCVTAIMSTLRTVSEYRPEPTTIFRCGVRP